MFNLFKKLFFKNFSKKQSIVKPEVVVKRVSKKNIFSYSVQRFYINNKDFNKFINYIESYDRIEQEGVKKETRFEPKNSNKQLKTLFYREYEFTNNKKIYQVVTCTSYDNKNKNSYFERTIYYNDDYNSFKKTYDTHCKESSIYSKINEKLIRFIYTKDNFILYYDELKKNFYIDFLLDDSIPEKENEIKIKEIIDNIKTKLSDENFMSDKENIKCDLIDKSI